MISIVLSFKAYETRHLYLSSFFILNLICSKEKHTVNCVTSWMLETRR